MTPSHPLRPAARPIERTRSNPIWLPAALVLALPLNVAYGLPADAAEATPLVTSGGPVTLVLNGVSSKSQAVSSRESGSRYAPRLILNRDSATIEPDAAPTTPRSGTGQAYYVDSRQGNDNNAGRSHTEPFRSLAKVNSLPLNPGDQLLLARGSRWSETLSPTGSGSSTDAITIGAYGSGAAPTVTGGSTCIHVTGSHVIIQDLQVTNCSWAGIQVAGRANTIQRNRVTDTAAGIHVRQGAVGNAVLNNELVDNKRMSVNTPSPSWDDSGAFGILVNGDYTDVKGNLIVGHDAFSYDYGRDGAAVEIYNGVGNHIHHNVAVDNDTFAELGGSRSANNTFAYNEVRSSLPTSTFLVTRGRASTFGPVHGTKLINNTAHLTGRLSQGFVCYDGCGPDILTMRNNILSARWKAGYADADFNDAFNIYYGGITQFPMGSTSRVADPMFRDPANGDLRLRAQSPAVDSGTSNVYSFDVGGLPQRVAAVTDRGAHERQ